MLSNAYFLAEFRFDTAENEPAKKLQILQKHIATFANFATARSLLGRPLQEDVPSGRRRARRWPPASVPVRPPPCHRKRRRVACVCPCTFEKCIFEKIANFWRARSRLYRNETKICKKICVRQHFSSSTIFAYFCTAAISKFSEKSV